MIKNTFALCALFVAHTAAPLFGAFDINNLTSEFIVDADICPGQDNPGNGGLLVTVKIPTDGIVPPSPLAPSGEDVRLAIVYLPKGYSESTEQYPVVYYLPGFMGDHTFFVCGDKLVLDDIINNKLVVPMIVVSVDASLINGITPDGLRNYSSAWYVNSPLNGAFETFLVNNTVDFIDTNFRTKANRAYRALAGQSMGGYGSTLQAMQHPEKYIGFGSESGTPMWAIVTTNLAHEPDGALYTLNSLIQPEIPTSGPNAGKITPENGTFTYLFFSISGALSPDIDAINGNPSNPFVGQYFVDLPWQMNGDGTPVLVPGPFIGAAPTAPHTPVVFAQSLVLDPVVVDRWKEKDPYFVMDTPGTVETLKRQAFFIDGGNIELINQRGARVLSEKFAQLGIDHEYLLYNGTHTACIVDEPCSRNRTVFQMLSAAFSANDQDPLINVNDVRVKIAGTGTILIKDDARFEVNKGSFVGIETIPDLEIINTNVTLQLNDNAQLLIGNDDVAGGCLQIGNLYSKAKAFGDPTLNNNHITANIIIDGPGALFNIGEQGFFGIAAGLVGQFPVVPNDWGVCSLFNVDNISLDIRNGLFDHNQIASGLSPIASLMAISTCGHYVYNVNFPNGNMRGGGNLALVPDCWRMQPVNITQAGLLEPGGIRRTTPPPNRIDMSTTALDFFYLREMASTGFYLNKSVRNLLSSAEQLTDRGNDPIFSIDTTDFTAFTTYLGQQVYAAQGSKEASIADVEGQRTIAYVDTIQTVPTFMRTTDLPVNIGQRLDYPKIIDLGAIGIWVESCADQRELISVYDVKPTA